MYKFIRNGEKIITRYIAAEPIEKGMIVAKKNEDEVKICKIDDNPIGVALNDVITGDLLEILTRGKVNG